MIPQLCNDVDIKQYNKDIEQYSTFPNCLEIKLKYIEQGSYGSSYIIANLIITSHAAKSLLNQLKSQLTKGEENDKQ